MARGDDNGVGWLIREGRVSGRGRKGKKRRDEVEGHGGAGANQPLSTPPIDGGHAPSGSCSRFLLALPSVSSILPPPAVSFTPTEIIVIGVARRLYGFTRVRCNLRCDASSSGSVPLSSTIPIDRRTPAFLVSKIITSISSIYLSFESLI